MKRDQLVAPAAALLSIAGAGPTIGQAAQDTAREPGPRLGDEATVATAVRRILVEQLGVDEEQVTPARSLTEDLGADSLDLVELVMAMEEEFGIEIEDEAAERITTVDDLTLTVSSNVSGDRAASRVFELVEAELADSATVVAWRTRLVGDLGMSDEALAGFVAKLEREFEVELSDALSTLPVDGLTVADLVRAVQRARARPDSAATPSPRPGSYLRPGSLVDADEIARLTVLSWHHSHAGILGPELLAAGSYGVFRERWLPLLADESGEGFSLVLCRAGSVVGVGAGGPYRHVGDPPGDDLAALLAHYRYGELFRGYVEPGPAAWRRARLLFHACSEQLRKRGFERAGLWTNSANRRMRRFAELADGRLLAERPATVLDRPVPGQTEVFYSFDL